MQNNNTENSTFRDTISTITNQGKRAWLYPKQPKGYYYKWRKRVSYILLIVLLMAPFLKVKGNQFLMFNVLERRFNIFGEPFWPQDFHLFVIMMIIGVVFIVIFTVAYGRIFCGWVCPQTIFMEMVFRRIEYWIEGDRGKQIRLDKMPWNAHKVRKRITKWILFFIISFLLANVFLAYIIGSDKVLLYVLEGPIQHRNTFIALLIFTAVFYFVFAWFREQVCVIACPYGRLQGVLLDKASVVVAYDYKRGEKERGRAKFKKYESRPQTGKGDCIDCFQCVHVCPTGIDIRNGTQLECINCTACMDACDAIMDSVGLPKKLISYTSEAQIAHNTPFSFNARLKGYSIVLGILISLFIGLLFLRNDIEASVLRLPGQLYERKENNRISNVYSYKLINKTTHAIDDVTFQLMSHDGQIELVSHHVFTVPKQGMVEGILFVQLPIEALSGDKEKIKIGVYSKNTLVETTETSFLGPRRYN